MKQLILPLDLPSTFEAKDFIVSPANEEAYLWLTRWPNWPTRCLALYGEEGCGKTHLSHMWQKETGALSFKAADLRALSFEALLSLPPYIILDQADLLQTEGQLFHFSDEEEKLFHLYNHITAAKGGILFLSHLPPAHWQISLNDLKSRLNVIPAIKIHLPDEMLLVHVIQKQFHDLQLKVDEGVILFLLKHIERSFESAKTWVQMLNDRALIGKRNITISLVKDLLAEQGLGGIFP